MAYSAPALRLSAVVIANGAAVSASFLCDGYRLVGVLKAADWTAADLSFEVAPDGSETWYKVIDNAGALVKITGVSTTVAEYYLPPELADCLTSKRMRIASTNTASEADVNQGAARTLTVVLAPY